MSRRSTKWYRKNEEEVMKQLGLEPTINSGAGFAQKEDGENDHILCQLKSTDYGSIAVKQKDLGILEQHAMTSHKIPVFALQYIDTGEVWIMTKPEYLPELSEYLNTGTIGTSKGFFEEKEQKIVDKPEQKSYNKRELRENINSRNRYLMERQKEREEQERAYKENRRNRKWS